MAKKSKNKTSKDWISKKISQIKSELQEDKEYWAPVTIALGVTAGTNSVALCPAGNIIIPSPTGWVNLIFAFIMLGFGLPLLWMPPRKNLKLLSSRILITAGFPILFFGIRMKVYNPIMCRSIIAIGVATIVVGFCLYCIYKKRQQMVV